MFPYKLLAAGLAALAVTAQAENHATAAAADQFGFGPVNLGYATHVPTSIVTTPKNLTLATYANIRFAHPPTGPLRFLAPLTPPPPSPGLQTGTRDNTDCLITVPPAAPFPDLAGKSWGSEDCLFLNVVVPAGAKPRAGWPVVHWLYGSAYAFGSKDWSADPVGLLDGAGADGGGFIFVASNYRMGATGWIASPREPNMTANAGLHDARAALEWTERYISRFGGDPARITAVGESSGAGMLEHMLVAPDAPPFAQAVLMSPGYLPRRNVTAERQALYEELLRAAGCADLACLRGVPEAVMAEANRRLLVDLPPGGALGPGIGFAPVVDGEYVRDLPGTLLAEGRWHRSVRRVVVANMANEAGLFRPPTDANYTTFPALIERFIPNPPPSTIAAIQAAYPADPAFPVKPFWEFHTDVWFACNAWNLADAARERTRRYVMSVPPGWHGEDVSYLFYVSPTRTPVASPPLARRFQASIRNFIVSGDPNAHARGNNSTAHNGSGDDAWWPVYGRESRVLNVSLVGEGYAVEADAWGTEKGGRCEFLRELLAGGKAGAR